MTWTTFLVLIGVIYAVYYGAMLLVDHLRAGKQIQQSDGFEELVFSEDTTPELVESDVPLRTAAPRSAEVNDAIPDDFPAGIAEDGDAMDAFAEEANSDDSLGADITPKPDVPQSPIETSGAVSIRELFQLARKDLIEFTGGVGYA